MSGVETMFAISAITLAILALYCIFAVIPSARRSEYRHEMWRLRDALAADVRCGLLPDDVAVRHLISAVEGSIVLVRVFRPWLVVPIAIAARPLEKQEARAKLDCSYMPKDQRERFEAYKERCASTTVRQTLLGTPSGWFALALLGMAAVVYVGIKAGDLTMRHAVRTLAWRVGFRPEPALAYARSMPSMDPESLSHKI